MLFLLDTPFPTDWFEAPGPMPVAVVFILGLLIGFVAGWYARSKNRPTSESSPDDPVR